MHGTYNPSLVAVSVLVAVLASYTTVDLAARIARIDAIGQKRKLWLLGGATAMGSGIWSMHFIGMLACKMPMELSYDPWITGFSLIIAIAISYMALHRTTGNDLKWRQLATGGALMGTGIACMHYVGMFAIEVKPAIHYRLVPLSASLAIAYTAALAALWLMYSLHDDGPHGAFWKRGLAAGVMGIAIAGMHYVGMSAAKFSPDAIYSPGGIHTENLVMLVAILSPCSLIMTLIVSRLDSRLDELTSSLSISPGIDIMTGISDRVSFLELAVKKMEQAQRDGTIFGVMLFNLDGFKTINDALGFSAGDELLMAFSKNLQRLTRFQTVPARFSGDEFVLLIEGARIGEEISSTAKSIFGQIETSFHIDKTPLQVTSSAGIAVYPVDGASVAALLMNASMAMNAAKQQGKNTWRLFEKSMEDLASRVHFINRSFGEALEEHQFRLVYQPKFSVSTNRVSGAEALIRWEHPVLGNIPPGEFIPIAEKTGRIVEIFEWVLAEVCRQLKVWERMKLPALKISMNISPKQLGREGYLSQIAEMVFSAGVAPGTLLFEITESAAMQEPKQASNMIREFQKAGFNFAIDDFGTGYSSMAYLQHFRVKELKIDRFFISSLDEGGEEEHAIVAAIVALAHALHMTVVAEGVETEYQFNVLKSIHCDEIQGYLLGRPMTPADLEAVLMKYIQNAGVMNAPRVLGASGGQSTLHTATV